MLLGKIVSRAAGDDDARFAGPSRVFVPSSNCLRSRPQAIFFLCVSNVLL
ncbi:Hypothetical protein GbCGDNIH3_5085 [Granulibacter bethesdensis]|uniref:Uncharacterized protein n=1 Tax=Granulibacter bethesdensis TaxID=364410 RepID=A0AAN0RDN7_9PROT|nr:Hypothetical protein GbCGDNIH3_5085 [Granulibacter bethesdensis]